MYARRSFIAAFALLILLSSIVSILRLQHSKPGLLHELAHPIASYGHRAGPGAIDGASTPCVNDLQWIDNIDVTFPIKYARRDITVKPSPEVERASITRIKDSLFADFQTIDIIQEPNPTIRQCKNTLSLEVPMFQMTPINASHLFFGMATTIQRLEESLPQIRRWLAHTQAKLFIVVRKPEDGLWPSSSEMLQKQSYLREDGLDVTLVSPLSETESYTENYFSLAKIMYTKRKKNTEWFTLMDDDTFFPSMSSLVSMLAKYDSSQQYYIGGMSESWWSVARYGLMAFGGAGIFLSQGLAETIDKVYETCQGEMHKAAGGDERVMRCVYEHTETKLTYEPGLHQMDIGGDFSGVFESGRMPLSLHHWKGGSYPVDLMTLVADICGNCVFQRWLFGSDTVLSNGYSIAVYPKGDQANGLDLSKAEETWTSSTVDESVNPGTAHSLSPARPKVILDDEKVQYKLLESATVGTSVRQSYIHRGSNGDLDSLFVLFWSRSKDNDETSFNETATET